MDIENKIESIIDFDKNKSLSDELCTIKTELCVSSDDINLNSGESFLINGINNNKIYSNLTITNGTSTNSNNITFGSGGLTTTSTNISWSNQHNSFANNNSEIGYKKEFLENILDGEIQVKDLIDEKSFSIFKIKKIIFKDNKTQIICQKKVDVSFIKELNDKRQLLSEIIDDYKENSKTKAIQFEKNIINFIYNGGVSIGVNTATNNTVWISSYNNSYNWTVTTDNTILI